MFVFLTYLILFLLKFRSGELVGCGIKFYIQRVPTLHTFDGPRYPKNKKYLKKTWWWHHHHVHHHVFSGIRVEGSIKSMLCGYSLDGKSNSAPNKISRSKFEKKHREICRKYEHQRQLFLFSSKINKYYFIIFLRRPILDHKFPLIPRIIIITINSFPMKLYSWVTQ